MGYTTYVKTIEALPEKQAVYKLVGDHMSVPDKVMFKSNFRQIEISLVFLDKEINNHVISIL